MIEYNRIKYTSGKFICFLFFVLVFGRGSSLVENFDPRINPIGVSLYAICLVYLYRKCGKNIIASKSPLVVMFWIVLAAWILLHLFILDGGFPILVYGQFLLHIIAGILLIKTYGQSIGVYFEKALVFLSAISLFFWMIEILGGHNLLLKSPILLENTAGLSDYSILFYTLSGEHSMFGRLCRNSGCAWEPGLFAVMVCLAIFFNISRNKSIKFDRGLITLLIALITTFSTTGYFMAMIIVACHYLFSRNLTIMRKLLYLCIISVGFIYVYNLPFMSEKIAEKRNVENFSIENGGLEWHEKVSRVYTVDRFEGLYLDWLNLKDTPIFGYGLLRNNSFVYKRISPYIITSNGIVKPLAQFGIMLGFLFFLLTYKSSVKLIKEYSFDVSWGLFLVIIVGSVSYMFDSTPIMRAIELYALYNMKNVV